MGLGRVKINCNADLPVGILNYQKKITDRKVGVTKSTK